MGNETKGALPTRSLPGLLTQYDNPIVRSHKVRENEPQCLSDQQLASATDRSFGSAVIYDTDYLDAPVAKKEILPN